MKFTTELPRKAGAYWWKPHDGGIMALIQMQKFPESEDLLAGATKYSSRALGGLWSGPLLAPEEVEGMRFEIEAGRVNSDQLDRICCKILTLAPDFKSAFGSIPDHSEAALTYIHERLQNSIPPRGFREGGGGGVAGVLGGGVR